MSQTPGMVTRGQIEVVACIAAGMTNEMAGQFLHLSPETIRSQVRLAMDRISPRPKTRTELVAMAVAYGWIHPCFSNSAHPELRIFVVPEELRRKRWANSEWWRDPTSEGAQRLSKDLGDAYPTIPSEGIPVVASWTNEASVTGDGFEGEGDT